MEARNTWKIWWHYWPDNFFEQLKDWRNKETRFWCCLRLHVSMFWPIWYLILTTTVSAQGSKSAQTSSKAPLTASTASKPTAYRPPQAKRFSRSSAEGISIYVSVSECYYISHNLQDHFLFAPLSWPDLSYLDHFIFFKLLSSTLSCFSLTVCFCQAWQVANIWSIVI